jgi:hypothetical protein
MAVSRSDLVRNLFNDPVEAHFAIFPKRHAFASPSFHEKMISLYWGDDPKVAILSFRGSAKSTLGEECIALKALIHDFDYAVIVCATVDRAAQRLGSIRKEIETNEDIELVFGNMVGKVWQETRLVLSNGVCIDAVGAGQNTRGMKYLSARPSFALIDDIEENTAQNDNVSTPEKRDVLRAWFRGTFLPALAQPSPIVRLCGTMLHEESLIGRYSKADGWTSLTVPVEHKGIDGERVASWPALFPISWIDKEREHYVDDGQAETFEQEYMCRATAPETRSFREGMFCFEPKIRTWEPVYVIYDPARTVGPQSCATGKVVASWLGERLLVWEATQAFWQPDELIDDIFDSDDRWNPLNIGVEVTGLNQFVEQPLRVEQAKRGHPLPLISINPPRGPGKEKFLLRLQPFFASRSVVFCGERKQFKKLIDELLGFPYGLNDTINALAYMLEIKPGEPVYARFRNDHVFEHFQPSRRGSFYLLLNSDGLWSCSVLIETIDEGVRVIADWCERGGLAEVVPASIRSARARAGRELIAYCPPVHFKPYDPIGLRPAAQSASQAVLQGGDLTSGQSEIRRLLQFKLGDAPLFQVSREASWTLRAMSGGYARKAGETAAMAGPYRVVGEALESFAAILAGLTIDEDKLLYSLTKEGRKYHSSVPVRQ